MLASRLRLVCDDARAAALARCISGGGGGAQPAGGDALTSGAMLRALCTWEWAPRSGRGSAPSSLPSSAAAAALDTDWAQWEEAVAALHQWTRAAANADAEAGFYLSFRRFCVWVAPKRAVAARSPRSFKTMLSKGDVAFAERGRGPGAAAAASGDGEPDSTVVVAGRAAVHALVDTLLIALDRADEPPAILAAAPFPHAAARPVRLAALRRLGSGQACLELAGGRLPPRVVQQILALVAASLPPRAPCTATAELDADTAAFADDDAEPPPARWLRTSEAFAPQR
jgi:hypothetical protein